MPGKKRKWTRPGIPTWIDDMAEHAERQAAGAAYVVCAILDQTQPDPSGRCGEVNPREHRGDYRLCRGATRVHRKTVGGSAAGRQRGALVGEGRLNLM